MITHVDELEPSDLKKPDEYDDEKLLLINECRKVFLDGIQKTSPTLFKNVVGVECISAYVVWAKNPEGGRILPKRDYRYGIDKLLDLLLRNVNIQTVFKTGIY